MSYSKMLLECGGGDQPKYRSRDHLPERMEHGAKDAIKGGKEVSVLFEEADGLFLHLQGKDRPKHMGGKEIKLGTCYEGWNKKGRLAGKMMSAGFEEGKKFQKLRKTVKYSQ